MTRAAVAVVLAVTFALAAAGPAGAADRGLDVFETATPGSHLGGLADRYPLSHYEIDFHDGDTTVDTPGPDFIPKPSGFGTQAMETLSQVTWLGISYAMRLVIELFGLATEVDILTGPDGALPAIAQSTRVLHEGPLGGEWIKVAILLFGGWGIVQLGRRNVQGAASATAVVFLGTAAIGAVIAFPQQTVGWAAVIANDAKLGFLAVPTSPGREPAPGNVQESRTTIADHLVDAYLVRPFSVLQTGGVEHCVNERVKDADGFPVVTKNRNDPRTTTCRDHLRQGPGGEGGYTLAFLKLAPGSPDRDALYKGLRDGERPPAPNPNGLRPVGTTIVDPFAGMHIDKADAPAADMMQPEHAGQRFAWTMWVLLAEFPVILVLGGAAAALFVVQVAFLFLLLWASVAWLLTIIPGVGHRFLWGWASKVGATLILGPALAIVLGTLVLTSRMMLSLFEDRGPLLSMGIPALFFAFVWGFRKRALRKAIDSPIIQRSENRAVQLAAAGAEAVVSPVQAIRGAYREGQRDQPVDRVGAPPERAPDTPAPTTTETREPVTEPFVDDLRAARERRSPDRVPPPPRHAPEPAAAFEDALTAARRDPHRRERPVPPPVRRDP